MRLFSFCQCGRRTSSTCRNISSKSFLVVCEWSLELGTWTLNAAVSSHCTDSANPSSVKRHAILFRDLSLRTASIFEVAAQMSRRI